MAEYDFFELTGVDFDPPVKKAEVIIVALEATKARYNVSAGEANKKAENDGIIKYLEKQKQLFINNGRVSEEYKKAAIIKREKVEEILYRQALIRYRAMNPSGNSEFKVPISEGAVREDATKKRLGFTTAKKVYEKAGFIVEKAMDVATLKEKLPQFTSESNFKMIQEKIKALRTLDKFNNFKFEGKEKVYDIYGFIAYLRSDIDAIDAYEKKGTKALCEMIRAIKAEFPGTTGNDTISLYNVIASIAETYIFKDDKLRESYNTYVKYHSDYLENLFEELKMTSTDILRDPGLANAYIDSIARVFPDQETATAIYNKESGLMASTPYLPERTTYYITCSKCGMQNKFASNVEAEKIDECQYCHSKLFKICAKCGKKVYQHSSQCVCGYVFPNLTKFNNYIMLAEEALKKGILDEAEENLTKAKRVAPEEKNKLDSLEKQIYLEKQKYALPKQSLEALISARKFREAEVYLSEIISKYPQLNIDAQKQIIIHTLDNCRKKFDLSKGKSRTERIDVAIDILDLCVDYTPAIEFLRITPPLKCTDFISVPDATNGSMLLKWKAQGERAIHYRLLRKEGTVASVNEEDGVVLTKNQTANSYTDCSVIPGKKYTYSLFSERKDIFSEPVSTAGMVLSVISDIRYAQLGEKLHFDWKLPENCDLVVVTKEVDGKEYIISQNAINNVDDDKLEYNKRHDYYFTAKYKNVGVSDKVRVSLVPTILISEYSISVKKDKTGTYDVIWSISQKGVDLQVYVNGNMQGQTRSDMKTYKMTLPKNGFYKVGLKAFSGGTWIESKNTVTVNTFSPCPFEVTVEERNSITAKSINTKAYMEIVLGENYPSDITGIKYFVKTKNHPSDPPPWVEEKEALNTISSAVSIDMNTYSRLGGSNYSREVGAEDAYYITLYAVYNVDGETVLSEPSKKRIMRPMKADVFWNVSKKFFGKKLLQLTIKANRPFSRHPHLLLCTTESDRQLMSADDPNAIVIMDIPETIIEKPTEIIYESFEVDYMLRKGQRLFLFEVDKIGKEEYVLRWGNGFDGKL